MDSEDIQITGLDSAQSPTEQSVENPDRVGEEGSTMPADQLQQVSEWMRSRYIDEDYLAIWSRRCSLGFYPNKECDRETLFWLAAYPAVAALRLGSHKNYLAETCIGQARMLIKPYHESQASIVAEIDRRLPRD
jgi:hypothetical protein